MSKTILTNVSWLAIAAGAYLAGKHLPGSNSQTGASTNGVLATQGPSLPSAGKPSEAETKAAKNVVSAMNWLKGFRNADGAITADRMSEAIGEVLRESDPVKSSMLFAQLLEELTPENAESAMKTIREKAVGFEAMRYMPLLAYSWGQKDGASAMAAFDKMGGREAGMGKASAMSGWAANDPDAAIAFHDASKAKRAAEGADQQPQNGGRGGRGGPPEDYIMDRGIVTGLAKRNIDEALAYVNKMEENRRGEYVQVLTEEKMKEGISSASAWAQGLADKANQKSALEGLGRQYSRQDPKAAAEWVSSISTLPEARNAVSEVFNRFAETDLTSAWKKAQTLSGVGQQEAYGEIFGQWGRTDAVTASQELTKLTNGPVKDEAIKEFSRTIARETPEDGMTWATSITDGELRQEAQIEVARRWKFSSNQEERAAAEQWISSNLPAEAQAKVNQQPDRGGWGGRSWGGR